MLMRLMTTIFPLLLLLLNACTTTTVTLLPDDKQGSQVIVSTGQGEQVLDTAGSSTTASSRLFSPSAVSESSLKEVEEQHTQLFEIQPEKVAMFMLYFEFDSAVLAPASKALIAEIVTAARERVNPLINIIGHTDASGDRDYNLALSLKRAKAVYRLLLEEGVDGATYRLDSHGEDDPLVVSEKKQEPRNRRVEIQIW